VSNMPMKDTSQDLPDLIRELLDNSHCREARRGQSEDHRLLGQILTGKRTWYPWIDMYNGTLIWWIRWKSK